ncbi:MAG: DMT family transporter [Deltaproteobacteria bacterium]|nr:DMT family transporter [Deltaproteobacteria bacterium]
MITRRTAIFFAILSSVLSSLGWIFQGEAVTALKPLIVASAQGILTGFIYYIHLRWTGTAFPLEKLKHNARDMFEFTFLRGFLASILLCYALVTTDSMKAMFFTKLEPYFIIFWSWILTGQTISRYHGALLAVHIVGAILLSTGGHFDLGHSQWGDLMVVVAVGLNSYSYLHATRLSKELGSVHVNGISAFVSGLFLLPFALAFSPLAAWNVFTFGWFNLLMVVLLFNVFALTLWYTALRHIEGWLVSALRAVGPVFAAPLAWIFVGQELGEIQILGAAIVLLTSAMLALAKSEQPAVKI